MSLRDKLIEALYHGRYMEGADPILAIDRVEFAVSLDAVLDTLEANADEWIEAEAQVRPFGDWTRQRQDQLARLLAVLREEPE